MVEPERIEKYEAALELAEYLSAYDNSEAAVLVMNYANQHF